MVFVNENMEMKVQHDSETTIKGLESRADETH